MSQRHRRKAPATFTPALDKGATAPFPCWSTAFGLVLHREVRLGGPPWRTDSGDCWAISDPVTGYRILGYHRTPLEALRALHRVLRLERSRSGRSYSVIVHDARNTVIAGAGNAPARAGVRADGAGPREADSVAGGQGFPPP